MASTLTNLYETLGLSKSAAPEEIRKAYRKQALKTHPDRLPPNSSPADKAAAEEQFRQVNYAYEVLNDDQKRKLYDDYGVWPPPTQPESRYSSPTRPDSRSPFSDPFFETSFGRRPSGFTFTDPFVLFNSLFGDLHRAFSDLDDDPFFSDAFPNTFGRSPFDRMGMGNPFGHSMFGGSVFGPGLSLMPGDHDSLFSQLENGGSGGSGRVYSALSEAVGKNGRWVSQSKMTRMINGRTEVITKRRDAEGNEHTTYSSPDGERYTINGVEQPLPGRSIANSPPIQIQSRPPPQSNTAQPPLPTSSYVPPQGNNFYAPPPVQPQAQYQTQYQASPPPPPQAQYQAQAQPYPIYASPPPPAQSRYSTGSAPFTYPTRPPAHAEPIPVQHQRSIPMNSTPDVNMNGYAGPRAGDRKLTSSHGHHAHESASAHSHWHSHRDRDREHAHAHRSSHSYRDSRSPRDSYADSHRERDRDKNRGRDREHERAHHDGGDRKGWRGGGW